MCGGRAGPIGALGAEEVQGEGSEGHLQVGLSDPTCRSEVGRVLGQMGSLGWEAEPPVLSMCGNT